jgi:DNA topoisomerase-3
MKSGTVCRAFLDQHAPKKTDVEMSGTSGAKPASPAQILFAEKIAQEKGVVIPDEAKASSVAMSAWIESNQRKERGKGRRNAADKPTRSTAPETSAPTKKSRKRKADAVAAPPTPARRNSETDTPLRIPYGNKEDALKLGARYRSGGWYAPPGVDLGAFAERGWL